MPNVMLLGAGRRVSFAELLIDKGFNVFSYETDVHAPIGQVAELVKGLSWKDPKVVLDIYKKCVATKSSLLIPLDDASAVLAHDVCHDSDIATPACLPDVANSCFDKNLFHDKLLAANLSYCYPLINKERHVIIKPRFGCGSKDISVVNFNESARFDREFYCKQMYVPNGEEYTVDAYFDLKGKMVDAVPRKRLRVSNGEVLDSVTEANIELHQLTEKIGQALKLTGPVCIQFIREKDHPDAQFYVMEANARFGGGCILSFEAGFDMIKCISEEFLEFKPISHVIGSWREGLEMRRVNREFFHENCS